MTPNRLLQSLLVVWFAAAMVMTAAAQATKAEPQKLVDLRKARDTKINAGLTAVYKKYLQDLATLQNELTKNNDLDGALAVRTEVEDVRAKLKSLGEGKTNEVAQSSGVGKWTVIFRSNDPADWLAGKKRDCPKLEDIPDDFKYLRLKRMDTSQAIIIPLTKAALNKSDRDRDDRDKPWWHGSNRFDSKAYHLGIGNPEWSAKSKTICVTVDGGHSRGWGFGHKAFTNDGQYASWAGEEIRNRRVEFEIAVTKGPLALFEEKLILEGTK